MYFLIQDDIFTILKIFPFILFFCGVVYFIEFIIWKKTTNKEERSNKVKHYLRLVLFIYSIIIFGFFNWIVSLIFWLIGIFLIYYSCIKKSKINLKEIKENKIGISFWVYSLGSFSFFLIQTLFSSIPFFNVEIEPNLFMANYFQSALSIFAIMIVVFFVYYFFKTWRYTGYDWGDSKFPKYLDIISFIICCIAFQILWGIVWFSGWGYGK